MLGIQVSHFLCKFLRGLNWSLATHKLELNNWVDRQATLHNYLQLINCRAFIFLKSQPGSKFGKSFSSFQSNLRRGIKCLLVNRATEYLDNGERIFPPTINSCHLFKIMKSGYLKNWEKFTPPKRKICHCFGLTENRYIWNLDNGEKFITHHINERVVTTLCLFSRSRS